MARKKDFLLVDGYNIIHAWDELRELAAGSLFEARVRLLDILCNYQGYRQIEVIVVFDAHKVKSTENIERYNNITIVYTKEAETADNYIERVTNILGRDYRIFVATSDSMEQLIIQSRGGYRISATELKHLVKSTNREIRETIVMAKEVKKNQLFYSLDEKTRGLLDKMRRGESIDGQ